MRRTLFLVGLSLLLLAGCEGSDEKGYKVAMLVMPDGHYGYGFPIGGVAAFSLEDGVISPGGIGYDINCGVRMLATNLQADEVTGKLRPLTDGLYDAVPSGLGSKSRLRYSDAELREVCVDGAKWAVEKGFGFEQDLQHMEEYGAIAGADPDKISERARKRGRPQLGTLGSGNHFLEISRVKEVYDEEVAGRFGLCEPGQVTVMVHCGSRGLGYQVADDYIKVMLDASQKYGIELPDKELACAPLASPEAEDYVAAMYCAVNYAFANRQFITHWVREVFRKHIPDAQMKLVYDAFTEPEPHYAQACPASLLKPIEVYPIAENKDPEAIFDIADAGVTRSGKTVEVKMAAVRSTLWPTSFEVNRGDTVKIHITNIEQTTDELHGLGINGYDINVVVDPGETKHVTFVADKPGVFAYYCTNFCSALHQEMQGYMLIR